MFYIHGLLDLMASQAGGPTRLGWASALAKTARSCLWSLCMTLGGMLNPHPAPVPGEEQTPTRMPQRLLGLACGPTPGVAHSAGRSPAPALTLWGRQHGALHGGQGGDWPERDPQLHSHTPCDCGVASAPL